MAQLLLIKNVNTAFKEVDDVVGFFKDSHRFSEDEKIFFNIQKVEGYTREALMEFSKNKKPDVKQIYKLKVANRWTLEEPEQVAAWKHTNGKWYFLVEDPKHMFTVKNMTEQEKIIVADKEATTFDKLNALAHLECKIAMDSKNMVEVMELNK